MTRPGPNQQCPFCGKWCSNKQAVRSHLRNCPNYEPRGQQFHVAYLHECGAIYVSGCDQPKRCCPACGVDIKDAPDSWDRLGETDHPVGPVPDGVEVVVKD